MNNKGIWYQFFGSFIIVVKFPIIIVFFPSNMVYLM